MSEITEGLAMATCLVLATMWRGAVLEREGDRDGDGGKERKSKGGKEEVLKSFVAFCCGLLLLTNHSTLCPHPQIYIVKSKIVPAYNRGQCQQYSIKSTIMHKTGFEAVGLYLLPGNPAN